MASEVEECVKRLVAHKGIQSIVVINYEGIPIRTFPTAMEHMDAVRVCGVFMPLVTKVRAAAIATQSSTTKGTRVPPSARDRRTTRARAARFSATRWRCARAQTKKFVKELDNQNEFTHMRIRTKKNETLVYPEKDYLLVVTQAASACVM